MSTFVETKGELYKIVKKRKLLTIEEGSRTDQEDGRGIEENIDELIIENEAEKFIELFEKTFSEETEEIEFDSEDGTVQDLVNKIILRIKEKLNNSTNTNGAGIGLLRLLFGFIEQFVRKDKSDKRWQGQEQFRGGDLQTLTLT